jgi:two-component system, cell cycle sensor histidine kinase and response regulator CckA
LLGNDVKQERPEKDSGRSLALGSRDPDIPQALTTILLVEDDNFVREATCEALCSAGFRVLTSNSADQAMQTFRNSSWPWDVVITDVVLPDRRGGELAKQLLVLSPALKIIYVSGYPEAAIQGRTDASSQSCYLQKPFSRGQLLEKITQVLAKDLVPNSQSEVTPAFGKP